MKSAFFVLAVGLSSFVSYAGNDESAKCESAITISDQASVEDLVARLSDQSRMMRMMGASIQVGLLQPMDQVAVAMALLKNGHGLGLSLMLRHVPDAELRKTFIEAMAKKMPSMSIVALSAEKELAVDDRFEILLDAIKRSSHNELAALYSTLYHSRRPSVARNSPPTHRALGSFMRLGARVLPAFGRIARRSSFENSGFSEAQQKELLLWSMERDPLSVVIYLGELDVATDSPLDVPNQKLDLRRAFKAFAEMRPDLLPANWVEVATAPFARRETALGLIRQMHRLSRQADGVLLEPKNSLEVISKAAGLSYDLFANQKFSSEALSQLYDVMLDTQQNLQSAAYENISIDPELLKDKRLKPLLTLLQNLKNLLLLRGNSDNAWSEIVEVLGLDRTGINAAEIQELTTKSQIYVSKALAYVLEKHGQSAVTLEEIEKLSDKWSSTKALFTLIARYSARADWTPQIKVLVRILRAELDGKAEELKRYGDPSDPDDQARAQAQTAVLDSPEKQAAWWRQWTSVALYDAKGNNHSESQINVANEERILSQAKSDVKRLLYPLVVDERLPGYFVAHQIIAKLVNENPSARDFKKELGQLKALSRSEPKLIAPENRAAFNEGIAEIFARLKDVASSNALQDDQIIVTATTHDPLTALSIGCLVKAGSCMSPDSGDRADVIPSVAIDGNIQVILSTPLEEHDFESVREFTTIKEWIFAGEAVETAFDGRKGVFTFHNRVNDASFSTRPLSHYFRRHQLKVGLSKDGKPGIRTEKAFSQSHPALSLMKAQVAEIKAKMAEAMNASVDVEVSMSGTRNLPAGTFSDSLHKKTGNGLSRGDSYVIPAVKLVDLVN